MERYWQGKVEVLGEKPVPVPLCATKIPRGLTWDRIWVSAVTGSRITTSNMARPSQSSHEMCTFIVKKYLVMCMCIHIHIFFNHIIQKYTTSCLFFFGLHICISWHAAITVCGFVCLSCHLNLVTYSVLEWRMSIRSTVYKSQTTTEPSLYYTYSSSCSFSLFTMSVSCVHMPSGVVQVPGCELLAM